MEQARTKYLQMRKEYLLNGLKMVKEEQKNKDVANFVLKNEKSMRRHDSALK